ncbi:MAG: hypothetical protein WCI11_03965 [Candidatus Methylumidiphilus sp.]
MIQDFKAIVLVMGGVFLMLGLIGNMQIKDFSINLNPISRGVLALLGALLVLYSIYIYQKDSSGDIPKPFLNPPLPSPTGGNGIIKFTGTNYAFGAGEVDFKKSPYMVEVTIKNTIDVTGFGVTNSINIKKYDMLCIIVIPKNITPAWGNKSFKLEINDNTIKGDVNDQDSNDSHFVKWDYDSQTGLPTQHKYCFDISKVDNINKFQIVLAPAKTGKVVFQDFDLN